MMHSKFSQFDITVVGAGPCGSVLAYELARRGLKVLLLDKSRLPRNKVCAGGITVRASSMLPFDFSELVENTIYGVRLSYRAVPQKVRTYEQPLAYMVMREKFDYLLTCRARDAGAYLADSVNVESIVSNPDSVTVQTNLGSFSTPVLVGADGANSSIVRTLKIKRGFEYGLGLNCHVPVSETTYSQWDGLMGLDYGIAGGYGWIFPKGKCLSVGAGGSFRVARILRPRTLQLIENYKLGQVKAHSIQGHLMPLKKPETPLVYQRILLVGDAAGVIDPLSGEGIFYGIKTSLLAASTIMRFMEGRIAYLAEYDEAVKREITPELTAARTIQKLNSITPRLFFHYLRENDRFWRAFCRMLRGESTYVQLKNRLKPPLRLLFRLF